MRKKALLALMMAAILLLSGCALIVKDEAVDNATEIIRMGDQVITKKEVLAQAEQELYDQYSMYSMFNYSYDVTDPANIQAAKDAAVDTLKTSLALTAKAKELGLDQLTDEELAEQNIYQNTIRLSIGTEHIDDIIADLENGFAAIK